MSNIQKVRKMIKEAILKENFNSIKNLVDKITTSEQARIEKMQAKLMQFSEWIEEKSQIYEKNYNNITKVLKSNGFEIENVHYIRQTGLDTDIAKFSLDAKPSLMIEAKLKMIGSRKPFQDKGYTARGGEKQQGHHSLSEKLETQLSDACPGMGFQVNPYSLMRSDNIIFQMWVR